MTTFQEARAFLLHTRADYEAAVKGFRWPDAVPFNWALDWFDAELAGKAESRDRTSLWIVDAASARETRLSFSELARRSNRTANFLSRLGLRRGDHLLLLLGNVVPLWETMLAAIKLGVVVIPATTLLTTEELRDRLERGRARAIVAAPDQLEKFGEIGGDGLLRITVGPALGPWLAYAEAAQESDAFVADGVTYADDPMLLYFTSGTTARPKLVRHSHRSYPVGHLSTMYWLGLQPGDVHLNISSPGWAKHAWSSFFAPWNAGATIFIVNQPRFEARSLLTIMGNCGVTTLCAPPTVWRLLIQENLAAFQVSLREVCGAGEPLNPEIIDQVRTAWGLTIRDGYGQTETTAMIGNSPGQKLKIGSMGRPLPGYHIEICDADENPVTEGEVTLLLGEDRPAALMQGYQSEDGSLSGVDGRRYHSGDVVFRDDEGYLVSVPKLGSRTQISATARFSIENFSVAGLQTQKPRKTNANLK
ncbi:MAG: AMP-binding protein, partial [Alphaproteobacteria bacterium]|nr:AMP-binding protein [Alphaproteobacteria bacterium]